MTSPAAQTPSAVVRRRPSTVIPALVVSMPARSSVELLDVGHAARRDQDPLDLELALVAAVLRSQRRDRFRAARHAFHERARHDFDPLVLQRGSELGGRVGVAPRRDAAVAVDDRDTRAEARERLRELEPDGARADDQQRRGELGELERRHVIEPVDRVEALDRRHGRP